MKAWKWVSVLLIVVLMGAGWFGWPLLAGARKPIRVGLLHSLTGPMAISEASMVDAEKMAIEEINASGGLLGRPVEYVVADGRSDPEAFAREAERLIREQHVSLIVGCWSSSCRKSVKPVVERNDHLLIYPVAYEGLEQSPNIIYTGAAPNQQIIPTVNWCDAELKAKSYFLIGTNSIWPRSVNTIIKDQLKATGGTLSGEEYVELGATNLDIVVDRAVKAKPDVILCTIEGDSNLPFYKKIRSAGGEALKIPIVNFVVAEDELRQLPARDMVNDYSVCNYFQIIDRPENTRVVKNFKARYGEDRMLSDSIVTAYNSVRLWAQAVRDAETDEVALVRVALLRQSLNAPEGIISVDRETQHTWRPFYVGKVRGDGQIAIVWSITKPIRPVPYPFSRTKEEWNRFLDETYEGWNRNWMPPSTRAKSSADVSKHPSMIVSKL